MAIKENRVDYQYQIDYQVWNLKKQSFSIGIPDSLTVESVQGQGITEWKVEKSAKGSVVTAWLSFAPVRNYTLRVEMSKPLSASVLKMNLPSLRVMDVNRENGIVAVSASSSIEAFAADSMQNLTAVDQDEVPEWLRSSPDVLMTFKYNRLPCFLNLSLQHHKDMAVLVAIADECSFTGLMTVEGYALVRYRYFIRNNHKQFLRIRMPEKWDLWSALIDGEAVLPAASDVTSEILIPLKKMTRTDDGAGFVLELVYWNQGKPFGRNGKLELTTPVLDINCQKINGSWFFPEHYKYREFRGHLESVSTYQNHYLDYSDNFSSMQQQWNRTPGSMNKFAIQKSGGAALSLPVAVDIPTTGKMLHFSKGLSTAGEVGDMKCRYSKKTRYMEPIKSLLFTILPFMVGLLLPMATIKPQGLWQRLAVGAVSIVGILLLYAFYNIVSYSTSGIPGSVFTGGIASLIMLLGSRSRKGEQNE